MNHALRFHSLLFITAVAACGCGGGSNAAFAPPTDGASARLATPLERITRDPSHGKIKHVIIIVQENRSFNDLFKGYSGATSSSYGYDISGHRIKLLPVGLETTWDIDHSSNAFFSACNGTGSIPGTNCRMNGFNTEWVGCGGSSNPCPIKHPQYAYVPKSETRPYFAMAHQFVLADQMYASNFDASSFVSHQYIISGQAESAVNYPFGAWGCPGGSGDQIATVGPQRQIPQSYELACWDPTTLGDELDGAGVPWAFYATSYSGSPGIWSAYQAIKHIYYGSDWKNDVISQPSQILTDISNGKLRSVNWVTPTWQNSDHAGSGSNTGPSWVSSVVNAVGQSQYWDSSAIFLMWDDYGGWYDSQAPAFVDYDGLGFRLPLLIISPYAKKNYVSHVHYEHGSILKFVEDVFGLPRLAPSDTRANSPTADCFDFKKGPRKFVPIPAPHGTDYFLRQPPDFHIPDAQ